MREYIEDRFDSSDGIHSCRYIVIEPDGEPCGVVQISHGMCEYIERYTEFMSFLADNGFVVCGNDHLGHGDTADTEEELGYFSEENGWQNAVEDLYTLTKLMKKRYPDKPYFLIGHSMGSFFARAYALRHAHQCSAYIFIGTADSYGSKVKKVFRPNGETKLKIDGLDKKLDAADDSVATAAIEFLLGQAEAIKKLKGDNYRSERLNKLMFGKYNEKIEDSQSEYDWISRDRDIVEKYAADPLCTFKFTVNGYINLLSALWYVSNEKWYSNLPKDIPMLLLAGTADPVGDYSEGVKKVYEKLCDYRCEASLKLYEGARHELLNEINRQEVYGDVLEFLRMNL
ncbi:MAG: alpha/beta hydrolase [Ruminococcus sp.]|nr:alpha/beta hydrolase [Ruminococcus sp.]